MEEIHIMQSKPRLSRTKPLRESSYILAKKIMPVLILNAVVLLLTCSLTGAAGLNADNLPIIGEERVITEPSTPVIQVRMASFDGIIRVQGSEAQFDSANQGQSSFADGRKNRQGKSSNEPVTLQVPTKGDLEFTNTKNYDAPEPTTLVLLGVGLLALIGIRRTQNAKNP